MEQSHGGERRPVAEQALAHADALYNFARYLTGHGADAEDLVQEAYTRAFAAWSRFDGRNLKAWLFTIVRNTFFDSYRKRSHDPTRADDGVADRALVDADLLRDDLEIHQLRRVVAADIEAALMTLSEDARTIILLDLEGMSELETAEIVGCAAGTVKSRLFRARQALRKRLEHYAR